MSTTPLGGSVAIVTGGSRGYGAGIAEKLKEHGSDVWITARDEVSLRETSDRLRVHAVRSDVRSPSDWDHLMATVMEAAGRLDLLVNNAGAGICAAPLHDQTDEQIQDSIDINLVGPLLGCRRAAAIMMNQGAGMIINISSVCAIHAWPTLAPYSAAKAGLNMLSHCLHTELRAHGVRVTTITPSLGSTDFQRAANIADMPVVNDPEFREQCMKPGQMGDLVVKICTTPPSLCIPDVTVQPMVQEIVPM